MPILTRTITCDLLDKEEVLNGLEVAHKKRPFISYNDVFGAVLNVLFNCTEDEIYKLFFNDIENYAIDITGTFLDSHPGIDD